MSRVEQGVFEIISRFEIDWVNQSRKKEVEVH